VRKNSFGHIWLLLGIVLMLFSRQAMSSQDRIQTVEQEVAGLVARIDSINTVISTLKAKSDSLSLLIENFKQKERLSFFGKRHLQEWLKESQALTQEQKSALEKKDALTQQIIQSQQILSDLYHQRVDSLLSYLEHQPNISETEKKNITEQIQEFRAKQERLKKPLLSSTIMAANVPITATDTPSEIKAKADFYRDLRDKMKRKASLVNEKIQSLHQESKLRQRLAQLIDDERLFDQRDESVANALPETRSYTAEDWGPESLAGNKFARNSDAADLSTTTIFATTDQLLQFDLQSLSPDEMDFFLSRLEKEKQRLLTVADSLNQIASQYDQQAKKLWNSLGRKPE